MTTPIRCAEFRPEGRPYVIRPAQGRAELDAVHRVTHDSIVAGGVHARETRRAPGLVPDAGRLATHDRPRGRV